MEKKELNISLMIQGRPFVLKIYPYSNNAKLFEEENDKDRGEARWQFVEGAEYEYVLDEGYQLKSHELVQQSKSSSSRGQIKTGIYVGSLPLIVVDKNKNEIEVIFEVRSQKVNYREDYKKMLHDITSHFTELVMMQGSPVIQRFEVDMNEDSHILYQQFAFLKSLIESEEFEEALNKIIYNPIRKWTGTLVEKDICAVKRLGRNELRQLTSRNNRQFLDKRISMDIGLVTIPRRLSIPYKKDTIDIPENRFVKYVLLSFVSFCSTLQNCKNASSRLKTEAEQICDKLAGYLNRSFFREIAAIQILSLNNPALQRRDGYREILQAWMMSKLAAKITWKGGDNVYNAGKRNVAALYEYWVFFKLLDIVKKAFHLEQTKAFEKKLVKTDSDHINLEIRQGHMKMIGGVFRSETRTLNVYLFYNRTFKNTGQLTGTGSWTTAMRPDYTLTIWPGEINEAEAEEQDLIVHIHFDAKYRLDKIILDDKVVETFEPRDEEDEDLSIEDILMNREKKDEERGIYKRVDLLKMHAYKDAIRRTSGAYILYPGSVNKNLRGFHEILPGLGAFCLKPNSYESDAKEIEKFLQAIVEHFLNRASQRERLSFHTFEVYKDKPNVVMEKMPETYGNDRGLIPDETFVLIGSYRDNNHKEWILNNRLYNTRTGTINGSVRLKPEITTAHFLLLHKGNTQLLLRLKTEGPRVIAKKRLIQMPYSELYVPSQPYYVTFELASNEPDDYFKGMKWNLSKMMDDGLLRRGYQNAVPQGISMSTLMKYLMKKE